MMLFTHLSVHVCQSLTVNEIEEMNEVLEGFEFQMFNSHVITFQVWWSPGIGL